MFHISFNFNHASSMNEIKKNLKIHSVNRNKEKTSLMNEIKKKNLT